MRGVDPAYIRDERERREGDTSSLRSTGSPEARRRVISSRSPLMAAVWMGRVGPVREGEGELMTRLLLGTAPTHITNTHHAAGGREAGR
jgi:hypothetical protein